MIFFFMSGHQNESSHHSYLGRTVRQPYDRKVLLQEGGPLSHGKKKLLTAVSVTVRSSGVLSLSECDDEGYGMTAGLGPRLTRAVVMDWKVETAHDRQNEYHY
ncbi:hypothetical protein ILYODFUR_016549 [Ilyodon furcidens]|uniref:Uncharacterized protein n=1 Tax=Ilyodon furcidens TaxID=33524 RepID=A0ABV0SMZ1_9TELE